jgi:hypothetical protein
MFANANPPIKLSNHCPMLLARMKKEGSDYYCKSCSKVVIDYSHKSIEEIIASIKPGTCGIFNPAHVQTNPRMPFKRRFLFYGLTFLSFFGFNVKPLQSQTNVTKKDSTSISISPNAIVISDSDTVKTNSSNTIAKKEKKGLFRRKKKARKFRPMGCPDF